MDLLVNPNIAYLVLVAATLLIFLALLTPGTGLFEIGALIALALAGYSVYNLPLNYWAFILLFFSVVAFIPAIRQPGKYFFLLASIIALVLGSAYLFRGERWWIPAIHPILALVVSVLTAGFFWIAGHKILEARQVRPRHDMEKLIGAIGETKTEIYQEGSVQVAGELWSAYSKSLIPAGTPVKVINREGFLLEVEQLV